LMCMGDVGWRMCRGTSRVYAAAARVRDAVQTAVQAVVDFAAPDACCLCGSRAGSPDPPPVALPPTTHSLTASARVPLLGNLAVVNHPFCLSCLLRFEECGGPARIGALGVRGAVGWVRMRGGELFLSEGFGAGANPPAPGRPVAAGLDVYSPFRMNDASLELVRLIKFSRRRSLAAVASSAMAHVLSKAPPWGRDAVLVPVPMHPRARRGRGFNQAELLARGIAGAVGLPVRVCLRKTVQTPPQSQTDHACRADNVRGAFIPSGEPLAGRRVCLIDDLVTTGATVGACAAALMAAGAGGVAVLCLARTP
jgi:ComF family protein